MNDIFIIIQLVSVLFFVKDFALIGIVQFFDISYSPSASQSILTENFIKRKRGAEEGFFGSCTEDYSEENKRGVAAAGFDAFGDRLQLPVFIIVGYMSVDGGKTSHT